MIAEEQHAAEACPGRPDSAPGSSEQLID